jgi:hypothetical protein
MRHLYDKGDERKGDTQIDSSCQVKQQRGKGYDGNNQQITPGCTGSGTLAQEPANSSQ